MEEREVLLAPVYVEASGEYLGGARLRRFQKELADIREGVVALSAPTGSGKTVTLLTDGERGVAVGLYPNNELLRSQVAGLHNFITSYMGMRPKTTALLDYCRTGSVPGDYLPLNVYESDGVVDVFGRRVSRVYVVGLSGDVVKALAGGGKLDTILSVSDKLAGLNDNEYAVALATPDTFFLLLAYTYGNLDAVGRLVHYVLISDELPDSYEQFDRLARALGIYRSKLERVARAILPFRSSTVFVDEYHLYGFYELSSFKALLYTLKVVHGWQGRLVLSSATPSMEFQSEIAKELGASPKQVDGLSHVKEHGDEAELVRGPVRLVFIEVAADGYNAVARLYKSSEHAHELIASRWFKEFTGAYTKGQGRGMVILEKVSHAELFAEAVYGRLGVKPVCLYSMPREDVCEAGVPYEHAGRLLVVGTGAKIGQGVEFPRVSFGVVARVTAHDFLQSLSRIGRRFPGESTVLVPLGRRELEKLEEVEAFRKKVGVTYPELAEWVERTAKPFMEKLPRGYEKLYASIVAVREHLLKLTSLVLHYRLSGARYGSLGERLSYHRTTVKSLKVIVPPDHLGTLLMFRSVGPGVTYCREIAGEPKCYDRGEDLGTIVRNYEVEAVDGRLVIRGIGRGDIGIVCESIHELKNFVESHELVLVSWGTLRDLFKCYPVAGDARPGKLPHLDRELEDQLFLVPYVMNDELAEYIYRTGRGLRIKLHKGSITMLYL